MSVGKLSVASETIAAPASVSSIEVEDLTVAYREKPALWDLDLRIPSGVLAAIIGPNGAGKSTLLKAVLGLIRPVAGSIRVFGQPYRAMRRRVAYVPQRTSVDWDFPTDVLDVAMMGTYKRVGWFRRPRHAEKQDALAALDRVGIADLAQRQIGQLSGGQQQRVFLARALVQNADLYVMDEPFQGVDAVTEAAIVDVLRSLRDAGKTVVAVHHDLATAPKYFDWVALLNVKLIAAGPVGGAFTDANIAAAYAR
jgi:manganese/zinc/iron transport system ATP- binding protein